MTREQIVDKLLALREAREKKDYTTADLLRDELMKLSVLGNLQLTYQGTYYKLEGAMYMDDIGKDSLGRPLEWKYTCVAIQ